MGEAAVPGDVDGSCEVNILDVIAVNKYILGVKRLTATDSLLILEFVLDMITDFFIAETPPAREGFILYLSSAPQTQCPFPSAAL